MAVNYSRKGLMQKTLRSYAKIQVGYLLCLTSTDEQLLYLRQHLVADPYISSACHSTNASTHEIKLHCIN